MQRISVLTTALVTAGLASSLQAAPRQVQLADPGVINPERIEYWMAKRGEINDSHTRAEIDAKVKQYTAGAFNPETLKHGVSLAPLHHGQDHKSPLVKAMTLTQNAEDSGKAVKVLGILVDFPDLPHDNNRLTRQDTGMYYSSYPASHYDKLLFSSTGFPGPTGQTLQSARQFYTEESGGSFDFSGKVFDWVTADNNAAHYGAHKDDDKDSAVPDLVFEAVSKLVARGDVDLSEFDQEDQYDRDGDGNVNEPDGIIDHIMVFHSSIGEEAGGGYLGDNAIWSHRYFVFDSRNQPRAIPGSEYSVFGYTIQPIDAAAGVCTHEFGHDLGLPDEYDLEYSEHGSPVGMWSLMSGGSWTGTPAGSKPSSMSAWARDYLQKRYGGNWINNTDIQLDSLSETPANHSLVSAINHDGINQLTLPLPAQLEAFHGPYSGKLQYYSGAGHEISTSAEASLTLPSGSPRLSLKAHWQIESGYDYAQILVNGSPVSGSYASTVNPYHANLGPHYTGNSSSLANAEGDAGWITIEVDLSEYAGQRITLGLRYVTDQSEGGYGFVADNLVISNGADTVWQSGGETAQAMTLDGFSRISNYRPAAGHGYFMQLRQFSGNDTGLSGTGYSPGVLLWYYNRAYSDNNVGTHPGYGFTGVVDADQQLIPNQGTTIQIKDAAFSRYAQTAGYNDPNLAPISEFDDAKDYSAPSQKQSGLVLPKVGLKMAVTEQASNSATATLALTKSGGGFNIASLTTASNGLTLSAQATTENGQGTVSYIWETGDGETYDTASISHTYPSDGTYTLTLTALDEAGRVLESSRSVVVTADGTPTLAGSIASNVEGATVSFSSDISGGTAPYRYQWSFGDDASSTQANPSHSYEFSGDYDISLTVTDANDSSITLNETVQVSIPLDGDFTVSGTGLTRSFSATVSGGSANRTLSWDFGDGGSASGTSASHTYGAANTYQVVLTISDGDDSLKLTKSVTVTDPNSGGSGGSTSSGGGGGGSGSLGWFTLLLLPLLGRRVRR
ncbi:immune inhibitor A domain-containing protein [Ferrimonas sp. YFM]|uniref:immune inhibitor A domain-containing protein n=1 Tax=Ferrimonas sp. YFM TaxID=3028878 RepID=UPI002573DE41|nr:immune inhibitor A domain-containing protein [Ferrimonas sp. YFM]BDY06399.1 peptidase M6 [Ferrimonas sp. YFM]